MTPFRRCLQIGWVLLWPALPLLAQEEAEPVPVIHFGDSITFGLRDSGVDCGDPATAAGYPVRLRSFLAADGIDIEPINEGVCGERTSAALSRIDDVVLDHPTARMLLVMEGTNDISAQVGVETIAGNLGQIAETAALGGLLPVYASIIPRGPGTSPDSNNAKAHLLGELLRERAEEEERVFVDVFGHFFETPALYENYYDQDGYHPNGRGYGLLAEAFEEPTRTAIDRLETLVPCEASEESLCLSEERFRVEIDWTDPEGETGRGHAVPLTPDTGTFWFFDEANLEVILKVLDARCLNGHYWVFYGALSNVEYEITVVDTKRGSKRIFRNPPENFASVGDTLAFPISAAEIDEVCGADARSDRTPATPWTQRAAAAARIRRDGRDDGPDLTPCVRDDETLCLNGQRFEIQVKWEDFEGGTGVGTVRDLTDDTGTFWFFNAENLELVVKVLDGRALNDAYWVFYGALSNVSYTLSVRDTETGAVVAYENPSGTFASVGDTAAFPVGEE